MWERGIGGGIGEKTAVQGTAWRTRVSSGKSTRQFREHHSSVQGTACVSSGNSTRQFREQSKDIAENDARTARRRFGKAGTFISYTSSSSTGSPRPRQCSVLVPTNHYYSHSCLQRVFGTGNMRLPASDVAASGLALPAVLNLTPRCMGHRSASHIALLSKRVRRI
eukprot:3270371-Rhodomonas_salina.2